MSFANSKVKKIYLRILAGLMTLILTILSVPYIPFVNEGAVAKAAVESISAEYDGSALIYTSIHADPIVVGSVKKTDGDIKFATFTLSCGAIPGLELTDNIEWNSSITGFKAEKVSSTDTEVTYDLYFNPIDTNVGNYIQSFIFTYEGKKLNGGIKYTVTKGENEASLEIGSSSYLEIGSGSYKYGESWSVEADTMYPMGDPKFYIDGHGPYTILNAEAMKGQDLSVGTHFLRAYFSDNGEFEACEKEASIDIAPTTTNFTVADIAMGEEIEPYITYNSFGTEETLEAERYYFYKKQADIPNPAIPYATESPATNWDDYSEEFPIEPGDYIVVARLWSSEWRNFEVPHTEFSIIGKEGKGTIEIESVDYKKEIKPIIKSEDYDTSLAKIYYKAENASDSEYKTEKPANPGKYTAKVVFPKNTHYLEHEASCNFEIKKIKGSASIKVKDIKYGEELKVDLDSDDYDSKKAVVTYKLEGQDDSKYIKNTPKTPGKYVARAVFEATDIYSELEETCKFTIEKAEGEGTITVKDCYIGMNPTPVVKALKNGMAEPIILYKAADASITSYNKNFANTVGKYSVRVVFPENDLYLETIIDANFSMNYMPSPGYSIAGTKGKGDFYISDVIIKAPAGYQISTSFGSGYVDSLKYSTVSQSKYMYFKEIATGALSDKVDMPEYKIDSTIPVIGNNIKNNSVIYKDSQLFTITDENLETVKVNGEQVQVSNGKASITLTANMGKKEYRIIATDKAGHEINYLITVAAPWMERGIIPVGERVRLEPGMAYELDAGEWKIENDETIYKGGMKFYVPEENELVFSKQ